MKEVSRLLCVVLIVGILMNGCDHPTPAPAFSPTPGAVVVETAAVEKAEPVKATESEEAPAWPEEEEVTNPTTLTYAAEDKPTSLDPASDPWGINGEIIFNVYETLISWDGADPNRLVPWLADDWSVSSDGLTYSFHIREGVTFHQGGALTAEDVEYSFERAMIQAQAAEWTMLEPLLGVGSVGELVNQYSEQGACQRIRDAITVGGDMVTFRLPAPFSPFLQMIAHPSASVVDKEWLIEQGGWPDSCDAWQEWSNQASSLDSMMNGTGPFTLEEWTGGDQLVLRRNEGYWQEPATLERFIIAFVPEWEMRKAMLEAGVADIIYVPVEHQAEMGSLVDSGTVIALHELGIPQQIVAFFNPHLSPLLTS